MTVRERSCGGLIYDAENIQPGDTAGIFGRLTLGVIEICRNRNDRILDLFTQCCFRVALQFSKDKCR